MEGTEKNINKCNRVIQITQSEKQRDINNNKNKQKGNRILGICRTTIKDLTFMPLELKKKRRKKPGLKHLYIEIMTKTPQLF